MKCPMFRQDLEDNYGNFDHTFADCIGGKCAWWMNGDNICALPAIAANLNQVTLDLVRIAKELNMLRPK